MGTAVKATERDQFWLDHEAKLSGTELTAKAYAAEQGLSLHALYQARKRLRMLGLLLPAASPRSSKKSSAKAVSFAKVEFRSPAAAAAEFRLSLPNGYVLEWSGGELPSAVVDLVERLTSPR
jgi:hypothetical protein